MPLRAIVFDFDGVIANSEPLHLRAYQDVLAALGLTLSTADYYARYLGYDDVGAFEAIARDAGRVVTATDVEALVARKAIRLEQLQREVSVLFPGAAEAIARCAAEVPIAVASGALRGEIEHVLAAAGLREHFSAIVSAEDTPVSKPAPDPYVLAIERLRAATGRTLDPAHAVALEDSRWGLESARAAGLRAVGIAQTYAADDLSADLVLASIGEVSPALLRRALFQD